MRAQVLLPKIFNFSFTYNSNNLSLKVGDLVEVPFGKSKEIGVVWKNNHSPGGNLPNFETTLRLFPLEKHFE